MKKYKSNPDIENKSVYGYVIMCIILFVVMYEILEIYKCLLTALIKRFICIFNKFIQISYAQEVMSTLDTPCDFSIL